MKFLILLIAVVIASVQSGVIPDQNADILPEAKFDPSEVTFHYYSRNNPDQSQQIYIGNMNNVNIDFSKPIKFIVHGYTQTGRAPWIMDFRDKYLLVKDVSIISVDWERPASGPLYDNAKQRTKPTGDVIGQFMDYLSSQGGDLSTMHCIGFSLGAHACGVAGKNLTSARLGRVTGLDPALPLYDYEDTVETMKPEDAAFVDVIHTCGGWLAFHHPLGHADFYPNDGTSEQPGCELEVTGECSHDRSHELFAESIMASTFVSLVCDTWDQYVAGECDFNDETPMGEPASSSARGKYWLETRGRSPFAMG